MITLLDVEYLGVWTWSHILKLLMGVTEARKMEASLLIKARISVVIIPVSLNEKRQSLELSQNTFTGVDFTRNPLV